MEKVFALEINLGSAQALGHPFRTIKRRWTTGILFEQKLEFAAKRLVRLGLLILLRQLVQRRHERLGHEHAAIRAKVACGIRHLSQEFLHIWMKSRSLE